MNPCDAVVDLTLPPGRVVNVRREACQVYVGRKMNTRSLAPEVVARMGTHAAGLSGMWGNMFPLTYGRAECVAMFGELMRLRVGLVEAKDVRMQVAALRWQNKRDRDVPAWAWRARTLELHGQALGCWCSPEACHGDELLKVVAELRAQELAARLTPPVRLPFSSAGGAAP